MLYKTCRQQSLFWCVGEWERVLGSSGVTAALGDVQKRTSALSASAEKCTASYGIQIKPVANNYIYTIIHGLCILSSILKHISHIVKNIPLHL